jgi:hypothetical protein
MPGTIGRRELQAMAAEQEAAAKAAPGTDDAAPEGWQGGKLAARAAALIAGQADPGGKPAEEEGEEGDEGEGGKPAPGGEEGDEGDEGEAGDEKAGEGGALVTADDAAKRLGLTRQQFNALTVQVGSESITLGDLKAKLPELVKLDSARTELDDERGTWELERIGTYRNLSAIIDALPQNALTAGLLRQLEAQHETTRARELETLHFARPRWNDPNYATAARERMTGVAKEYGFSRREVEGLLDHRQVLLLQDFADLRERVRSSRDQARKIAEGGADRPSGQKGAANASASSGNGSGMRRAQKPTQEAIARNAGAIMRRR